MKKIICSVFFISFAWFSVCLAADFTDMSNGELFELRGTIKLLAAEDVQKAYDDEWNKRLESMSSEERQLYEDALKRSGGVNRIWGPGTGYERQNQQGRVLFGGSSSEEKNKPQK